MTIKTPQKTREKLEYLCDRVEASLAAQHCPVRITGGTIGPRGVKLTLQPMPRITFEQIQTALSIPVYRSREGIVLFIRALESLPILGDIL